MSLRAMLWALHDAEVSDPTAALVLIGLADHADDTGRNAFPSRARLSRYARCSVDTVDRRLKVLLSAGLIRHGDQSLTAALRPDQRPVVYDLALSGTGPQPAAPRGNGAANEPERGRRRDGTGPHGCGINRPLTKEPTRGRAPEGRPRDAAGPRCPICPTPHPFTQPCQSSTARPAPTSLRSLYEAHREDAR